LGERRRPSELVDERLIGLADQLQAAERHLDELPLDEPDELCEFRRICEPRLVERDRRILDRVRAESDDPTDDLGLSTLVLLQPPVIPAIRWELYVSRRLLGLRPVDLDHLASQFARGDRRRGAAVLADRLGQGVDQA
jgi:hypothetical protein